MILHGHGVEVRWDGETLVARGTTQEGRAAVNAPEGTDRVTLTAAGIDAVALLEAPRKVGGVLILVEPSLEEHRLHFRRDARLDFVALATELEEASDLARSALRPVVDLTEPSPPAVVETTVGEVAAVDAAVSA